MPRSPDPGARSRRRYSSEEDVDRRRPSKRKSPDGRSDYGRGYEDRKRRRYSSDEEDPRPRRRSRSRETDRKPERRSNGHSHLRRSPSPYSSGEDRYTRRRRSPSPPTRRSDAALPSQSASYAITNGEPPPVEKQKPNYQPTGLLAKEANTVSVAGGPNSKRGRDIVLKYHEPPEARKPPASQAWRLYHFSGAAKEPIDTIPLYERSCWLFGRETSIVDVELEEKTCGKQHAVIQFRYSTSRDEYGDKIERVRPYLIDLESKGGTVLNGKKVEESRFVELRDGDVLRFAEEEGDWIVMLPPPD